MVVPEKCRTAVLLCYAVLESTGVDLSWCKHGEEFFLCKMGIGMTTVGTSIAEPQNTKAESQTREFRMGRRAKKDYHGERCGNAS